MTETLKPCRVWINFVPSDNGITMNIRKYSHAPFDDGTEYILAYQPNAKENTRAPDDVAQIVAALKAVYDEGRFNHNTRCRKWWPQVCAALEELEG